MSKKIAVVSGKGGTGKTTVAAGISLYMGILFKKAIYLSVNPGDYSAELLLGVDGSTVGNLSDILSGDSQLSNTVKFAKNNTACILPPDRTLKEADSIYLNDLTEELKSVYDFVIIDAPPGMGYEYELAVSTADEVIVVVLPEEASIRAAAEVCRDLDRRNIPAGIVINRLRSRKTAPDVDIDTIIDRLSTGLLGVVPNYTLILSGDQNLLLDSDSGLAEIMKKIAKRICGEYVRLTIPSNY